MYSTALKQNAATSLLRGREDLCGKTNAEAGSYTHKHGLDGTAGEGLPRDLCRMYGRTSRIESPQHPALPRTRARAV